VLEMGLSHWSWTWCFGDEVESFVAGSFLDSVQLQKRGDDSTDRAMYLQTYPGVRYLDISGMVSLAQKRKRRERESRHERPIAD
jgi:hypothetical protein